MQKNPNLDGTYHYSHSEIPETIAKYNWQLSNLVAFIRLNIFLKLIFNFGSTNHLSNRLKPQNYYQGVLFEIKCKAKCKIGI